MKKIVVKNKNTTKMQEKILNVEIVAKKSECCESV